MKWGISVLEIAYEAIRKLDSSSWSILSLMFRAQILAQTNPALAEILSGVGMSAQALQRWQSVMEAQNQLISNQSMLIMGKDSNLQSHQYTFGGIADVYDKFQMEVSGASYPVIPISILFGKTVTGLSQTNEADIRIYEQDIAKCQKSDMKPGLQKLYNVATMSEFGEIPEDIDLAFPSIRVMTEEEKMEMGAKGTTATLEPFAAGVTSQKTVLQDLSALSETTGLHTNITKEVIEAADDQVVGPMQIQSVGRMAGAGATDEAPKENKAKSLLERINGYINSFRADS